MSDIMDPTCWETRLGLGHQGTNWEAKLYAHAWRAAGEAAMDPPVSYDLSIAWYTGNMYKPCRRNRGGEAQKPTQRWHKD